MAASAQHGSPRGRSPIRIAAAGAAAGLACALACCLPPVLVALGAGASAAGMAGMGQHGTDPHGTLGTALHLLHRISPALLIVSILLVTTALTLRRAAAAVPALLAGVLLYVSVHVQSDPAVMYAGMAVGYGSWLALYRWTRPARLNSRTAAAAPTP